jgi:tetratricopeptide (TPR) repeat protein
MPSLRWNFADELLRLSSVRDSTGAQDALLSMAGDTRIDGGQRLLAARRLWELVRARGAEKAEAPRVQKALADIPPTRWNPDLLVGVARGLRQAGLTAESRTLLEAPSLKGAQFAVATLERALADLRDGPPEKALPALKEASATSPEARFRYAEGLFFAGQGDSAKAAYQLVSENPADPFAGAALERIYLIEDADPVALRRFGRIAWHDWRGDDKTTLALADSLFRTLSPGPLWAQVAVFLSERREAAGQYAEAVGPLLDVATQRPGDRLAPLARQRAGDLYAVRLKDPKAAMTQYEECLTRYPRAWNSAEVRRKLEALRKQRL